MVVPVHVYSSIDWYIFHTPHPYTYSAQPEAIKCIKLASKEHVQVFRATRHITKAESFELGTMTNLLSPNLE